MGSSLWILKWDMTQLTWGTWSVELTEMTDYKKHLCGVFDGKCLGGFKEFTVPVPEARHRISFYTGVEPTGANRGSNDSRKQLAKLRGSMHRRGQTAMRATQWSTEVVPSSKLRRNRSCRATCMSSTQFNLTRGYLEMRHSEDRDRVQVSGILDWHPPIKLIFAFSHAFASRVRRQRRQPLGCDCYRRHGVQHIKLAVGATIHSKLAIENF